MTGSARNRRWHSPTSASETWLQSYRDSRGLVYRSALVRTVGARGQSVNGSTDLCDMASIDGRRWRCRRVTLTRSRRLLGHVGRHGANDRRSEARTPAPANTRHTHASAAVTSRIQHHHHFSSTRTCITRKAV